MSHRKRSWTVENTWKCSSCDHHNKGHEMVCSSCGNPKDKSEKYALGDTTKPVTDPAKLKEASVGRNWTCIFCQYDNRAHKSTCVQCGASRSQAAHYPENYTPPPSKQPQSIVSAEEMTRRGNETIDRVRKLAGLEPLYAPEVPLFPSLGDVQSQANRPPEKKRRMISPGDYRNPPVFEDVVETAIADATKTTKEIIARPPYKEPVFFDRERAKRSFIGFCAFLLIAALVSAAVWAFVTHEHPARVTSIHWQFTRELQQRYTRHSSDWGSPPGAFNVSCELRQHGTDDCHPHDCNAHLMGHDCHGHDCNCHTSCEDEGNGYSSCSEDCDTCYDTCYETEYDTCYDQCPVYAEWCNYDFYVWVHEDTEVTSGTDHHTVWGTRLVSDGSPTQRILTTEEYVVNFAEGEDHWTYNPNSLSNFNRFNVGSSWDVKTNLAGMIWPQHQM